MPETRLFAVRVDGCIVVLYAVRITYVPLVKNLREKGKLCALVGHFVLATLLGSGLAPSPSLRLCPRCVKARVEPR